MSSGNTVGTVDGQEVTVRSEASDEQPAVGVVLRGGNEDVMNYVGLRSAAHDCTVFLTHRSDSDADVLNLLERFNVRIVPPSSRSDNPVLLSPLLSAGTFSIVSALLGAFSLLIGIVACVTSLHLTNGPYDAATETTDG